MKRSDTFMPHLFDPDIFRYFRSTPKESEELKKRPRGRSHIIHSIEAKIDARMSRGERFADWCVNIFGSIRFLAVNIAFFAAWIALNAGMVPGVPPFDPFPFILLTMIVSLEAIALSIFVLISQNQESKVSKLREEIDIQVNTIAEKEITKVIHLLSHLMKHLNVPYDDPELQRMMKPLDTAEIEAQLESQLGLKDQRAPQKP